MDTKTAEKIAAEELQQHLTEIKAYMPETYKSIQAKAAEIGNQAFALVRAGLRGEPNRFWAMERGWVKGTTFNQLGIQEETAKQMVQWGCAYVCIFGVPIPETANGSN